MTISTRTARIAATALVAGTTLLAGATGASATTGVPPMPACTTSIVWSWRHLPTRVTDCTRLEAYARVMKAFNGSAADQTAAVAAVMGPYRRYDRVQAVLLHLPAAGTWNRECVRNALLNIMQTENTVESGHRVLSVMDKANKTITLAQDVAHRGLPWRTLLDKVSVDYIKVAGESIDVGARAQVIGSVDFLLGGC